MLVAAVTATALTAWFYQTQRSGAPATEDWSEAMAPREATKHRAKSDRYLISWFMPQAELLDGPKDLTYVADPATGTFWGNLHADPPMRYDATLLEQLDSFGSNDANVMKYAIGALSPKNRIEFGEANVVDDFTRIDFTKEYDNRIYLGHGFAWKGNVFLVSVAYPDDQPEQRPAAQARLDRFVETVVFEHR